MPFAREADAVQWMETPRMRWRTLGWGPCVRELLISLIKWAIVLVILGLTFGTGPNSHWQGRTGELLATSALFGVAMRLVIELVPGHVDLRRGMMEHQRGAIRHRWPVRACNQIRWTDINGLVRLDVEAMRSKGKMFTKILAVPIKRAEEVRRLIAKDMASDWRDHRIAPADFGTTTRAAPGADSSPILGYAPKPPPPAFLQRFSLLAVVMLAFFSLLVNALLLAFAIHARSVRGEIVFGVVLVLSIRGAVIQVRRAFRQ
jgi:hypothetical protein